MALKQNKKGIFFTSLVLLILTLFLISFTFYSDVKERKSTQQRIETLNSFLFSIEEDIPRKLYISGFRAILLLENKIIETGLFIPDIESSFSEIVINGTMDNLPMPLMLGANFSDIQKNLKEKANEISANINLYNAELSLTQEDPWNIKVTITSDLFLEDIGGEASWNKTSVLSAYIPIEKFEDPLYIVNTNGALINNITKTPYPNFNNIQDLNTHITNSYYNSSTDAPSFLNRMQGNTGSNINGIESFVNLQKLSQQGITVQEKSVIDHIYFSSGNPSTCHPAETPSWFRIDDAHKTSYEVSC
ncbi:MAG: hypothetical protein Q8P57_03680 [Candidatus Pacearchaeota archaeon]|nr:hypothetical protein [Candidatus Pacearchaeota archaeon]